MFESENNKVNEFKEFDLMKKETMVDRRSKASKKIKKMGFSI